MPTYDYRCENCGHEFEEFQSITAKPLTKCPSCGKPKLQRLIGAGGGVIFKGTGFYQTDYRSDSYKKAAESETKAASDAAKPAEGAAPAKDQPKPGGAPAAASDGKASGAAAAGGKPAESAATPPPAPSPAPKPPPRRPKSK